MKALFDSNILIDYLNGINKAKKEIARYEEPCISILTWIEVLVGTNKEDEQRVISSFLSQFGRIDVGQEIARRSVKIRQEMRLRLPDAIIWATAQHENCLFVTRNSRDFPADNPGIRFPYKI